MRAMTTYTNYFTLPRIHKENRKHDRHLYVCDCCGHQMNDDAVGAENIYLLGTQWVSGLEAPHFEKLS